VKPSLDEGEPVAIGLVGLLCFAFLLFAALAGGIALIVFFVTRSSRRPPEPEDDERDRYGPSSLPDDDRYRERFDERDRDRYQE
jgi:hypothetical protein